MTKEEQNKIWRSLRVTFILGCAVLIFGLSVHLGLGRKYILFMLCAYVFGTLAIGMSLYKMMKFKKFLKSVQE
ncbi:MAG: hypothetical protein GQ574_21355 [Crocinitomix sp.]|nr:hypothetical protein [Crocinitomix sp.]